MEFAFNNTSTAALIYAIASIDINQNLLAWLSHVLSNRQAINDELGIQIAYQITWINELEILFKVVCYVDIATAYHMVILG